MAMSRPPTRLFGWTALWAVLALATPAPAAPHGAGGVKRVGAAATCGDGAGDAWAGAGGRHAHDRPAAVRDTLELVVVSRRPWTSAVAVTLSFTGGYGDDPPGAEGSTWLLGMVLERAARANLAETGAVAEIEVQGDRTWVTLLATSSDWASAYDILVRTLAADPLDPVLAAELRADLSGQVLFQRNAPVRAFELEAQRMLFGAERARPPMGTPSSVTGVTVEALEATRARVFRLDGAGVAVVGGVAPDEGASVVGPHRTMARRGEQGWVVEGAPLPSRAAGWAWEAGGRTSVGDDITNNWILTAYPFSGAIPRRPMKFLAHVIGELLVTNRPAPGLISRRVEVRELPGGPVLQVTIAAQWPTVRAWEQRVVDIVAQLSAGDLSPDDVYLQYRRYRSERTLTLADPGREGRRLLIEAESDGGLGEPLASTQGLSSEELQRAAADLREPRVLVYGPGEPPS